MIYPYVNSDEFIISSTSSNHIDYSFTFNFIPLVLFPMSVPQMLLPIKHDIIKHSPNINYKRFFVLCFMGIAVFSFIFTVVSYKAFGSEVKPNLFYHYGPDHPYMFYLQIVFLFPTTLLDIVTLFPSFRILYSYFCFDRNPEENYIEFLFIKFLFFIIGTALCLFGTGLINYLSFLSAILGISLSIIVPLSYFIFYQWKKTTKIKRVLLIILSLFCIVIWLVCSFVSFKDLINGNYISDEIALNTKR